MNDTDQGVSYDHVVVQKFLATLRAAVLETSSAPTPEPPPM